MDRRKGCTRRDIQYSRRSECWDRRRLIRRRMMFTLMCPECGALGPERRTDPPGRRKGDR